MAADSFLSNAGWLFFAAWSAIVVLVALVAFAKDIFPSQTRTGPKDHV